MDRDLAGTEEVVHVGVVVQDADSRRPEQITSH